LGTEFFKAGLFSLGPAGFLKIFILGFDLFFYYQSVERIFLLKISYYKL
jgi:hypothetical protein